MKVLPENLEYIWNAFFCTSDASALTGRAHCRFFFFYFLKRTDTALFLRRWQAWAMPWPVLPPHSRPEIPYSFHLSIKPMQPFSVWRSISNQHVSKISGDDANGFWYKEEERPPKYHPWREIKISDMWLIWKGRGEDPRIAVYWLHGASISVLEMLLYFGKQRYINYNWHRQLSTPKKRSALQMKSTE